MLTRRFYREVARQGVAEGYAVISALVCDKGIVATTLGVRYGETYFLLRISHTGKTLANFSPGLLATERTMEALHAQGVRRFDLSIGNKDYKRRLGAEQVPLTDVSVALSWRGVPSAWRDHAAQGLRRHQGLPPSWRARWQGRADVSGVQAPSLLLIVLRGRRKSRPAKRGPAANRPTA